MLSINKLLILRVQTNKGKRKETTLSRLNTEDIHPDNKTWFTVSLEQHQIYVILLILIRKTQGVRGIFIFIRS